MTRAGLRLPRLTDVAERAGVSMALASRVLAGDGDVRVRVSTRERIVTAARELKYVPNGAAQALRLARASALGLVVHDVNNPVHAEVIRGAQAASARAGQVLLLAEAGELAANTAAFDRLLGEGRIDGLLWHGNSQEFDDKLASRAAERLPTLLVNSRSRAGVSAVRLADFDAARVAVDYLVGLGHERIGYVGGHPGSDLSERRHAGWAAVLNRRGLPENQDWVVEEGWDAAAGHAAMTRLLTVQDRPSAVFVANVVICVGVLAAAREHGIHVPEELSVVTVHDAWFAAHGTPPITTVRLPLYAMGGRAVELLLESSGPDHICRQGKDGRKEPDEYVLDDPVELVERGSAAPVN